MSELNPIERFRVHAALCEHVKLEISRDEALAIARCLEERQQIADLSERAMANLANARALADRREKATDELIWRLLITWLFVVLLVLQVTALWGSFS